MCKNGAHQQEPNLEHSLIPMTLYSIDVAFVLTTISCEWKLWGGTSSVVVCNQLALSCEALIMLL